MVFFLLLLLYVLLYFLCKLSRVCSKVTKRTVICCIYFCLLYLSCAQLSVWCLTVMSPFAITCLMKQVCVQLSAYTYADNVALPDLRRCCSIDRYLLPDGPTAVGPYWDRQTDGQTNGHRIVSQTLLRILCGICVVSKAVRSQYTTARNR